MSFLGQDPSLYTCQLCKGEIKFITHLRTKRTIRKIDSLRGSKVPRYHTDVQNYHEDCRDILQILTDYPYLLDDYNESVKHL